MSNRFSAVAQMLLPQKLSGRIVYRLARSRRSWLKSLLIGGFCRIYDIDLTEARVSDKAAYASFNEFFTRELKSQARPIAGSDEVVVSPADGRLTEFGKLDGDRLLQAKGKQYTTESLLAEQPDLIQSFVGGSFMTIYLAPHNYHRVHAPVAGRLDRGRYIPGKRFSVNAATAATIDDLYCKNERVALWISSTIGYAVVVMVGALNVASLTTILSGEIPSGAERLLAAESPLALPRGAEIGRFNLGSTVVMLFPKGSVEWLETLVPGQKLTMGQALGRFTAGPTN
jgi:phosphatidylserine decarboxylase